MKPPFITIQICLVPLDRHRESYLESRPHNLKYAGWEVGADRRRKEAGRGGYYLLDCVANEWEHQSQIFWQLEQLKEVSVVHAV
jgi:hypothetical protein